MPRTTYILLRRTLFCAMKCNCDTTVYRKIISIGSKQQRKRKQDACRLIRTEIIFYNAGGNQRQAGPDHSASKGKIGSTCSKKTHSSSQSALWIKPSAIQGARFLISRKNRSTEVAPLPLASQERNNKNGALGNLCLPPSLLFHFSLPLDCCLSLRKTPPFIRWNTPAASTRPESRLLHSWRNATLHSLRKASVHHLFANTLSCILK